MALSVSFANVLVSGLEVGHKYLLAYMQSLTRVIHLTHRIGEYLKLKHLRFFVWVLKFGFMAYYIVTTYDPSEWVHI